MRFKITSITVIFMLFYFFFATVSCNSDNKNEESNNSSEAAYDISAGELIYKSKCQNCHQADGQGIPGAFPSLQGKQADLNTIINGREGTIMKAFKFELSDLEIANVTNFINRSWNNNFPVIHQDTIKTFK